MWISGLRSRGPASSSKTRAEGSALSRLASTQPAEPAPTMMKSAFMCLLPGPPAPTLDQLARHAGGTPALRITPSNHLVGPQRSDLMIREAAVAQHLVCVGAERRRGMTRRLGGAVAHRAGDHA